MKRRARRGAFIFTGLVCLLLAVPAVLTWRAVRQEQLNQALIAAVKANDANAVLFLLQRGADANARDDNHRPMSLFQRLRDLLMDRARRAGEDAPTPLILQYAGVTSPPDEWPPPQNPAIVRSLLQYHTNPNVRDSFGNTPLILAAMYRYHASAKLLIEHHADVNAQNQVGETALMWEAGLEKTWMVRLLLEHGARVNLRDRDGMTALMESLIDHPDPILVKMLIEHGADVNARDNGEGADVNGKVSGGNSTLSHASDPYIIRLLKATGAKK